MQEVQRFNKVLKSCVLLGDLVLLNLLLWGFYLFFDNQFWCENSGSILQGMILVTLCYLLCNMHSGVILHRSVVRPEQIMIRVLRNMVPFVLLSVCILLLFSFPTFWFILYCSDISNSKLSFGFSLLSGTLSEARWKCP